MAPYGFGHLWMQSEMSDVVIVLSVAYDEDPADAETPEAQSSDQILQQFPGHRAILSPSPYFAAQASSCTRTAP